MLSAKGNASFFGFGPKGAAGMDFSGGERKKCFLNDHGARMVDVSYWAGIDSAQDGRSVAQADLDHDGVPELLVAMRDHPMFHVWQRRDGPHGHAISLDVRSVASPNRDAVGATVTARCGERTVTRLVSVGTGFAAQDAHPLTLGVGDCATIDELRVRWPSKAEKVFRHVKTDERYTVDEDKLHDVPGFFRRAAPPGGTASATAAKATSPASRTSPFATALAGATAWDANGSHAWTPAHDLVYVDLWASWCEACKRDQPIVDALSRRFGDRVDFVGVSMDEADGESIVAARAKSTAYPLLLSKALLPAATVVVGEKPPLPEGVLISRRDGRIVWRGLGVPSVSELEAAIDR